MRVIQLTPEVAPDRREIVFRLAGQGGEVECAITREALEEHFWLPGGADHVRMLKAFSDGTSRIAALAERKLRLHPSGPVRLTSDDFRLRN
jgi:hypothetical protein